MGQPNNAPNYTVLNCTALMKALFQPLNFAQTLIKLGHEPYQLTRAKKWLFFGKPVYFQANTFKYIKNIYESHGFYTLYTGIGANVAYGLTSKICLDRVERCLDDFFPELDGQMDNIESEVNSRREWSTHQLIRYKFRQATRDTVSHCISAAIAHPFLVIMVRQIAQHIGNETKYSRFGILQPLRLIIVEEGPAGLFSGLIPTLIGVAFSVWGLAVLSGIVEEGIKYMEKEHDMTDKQTHSYFSALRSYATATIKCGARVATHPFNVVATVMAVVGSGLSVSKLPFLPLVSHWSDVYAFLSPNELYRGQTLVLRHELGPVRTGTDGKLYADKSNFVGLLDDARYVK